jgi:hypothetical protein
MSVDKDLLGTMYRTLDEGPLEPDSPYYEDVYAALPEGESPIATLGQTIEWGGSEGIHLFSGFRGSGKTTELKRMKKDLEGKDYFVLMADALDYINPAGVIEISDLLIALAGAFNDQLEQTLNIKLSTESYWTRLGNFLNTRVQLTELELSTGAGIDVKAELKASPSFRKQVQDRLKNHLSGLKAETDKFFEDGVKRIEAARQTQKIVFIFDSLEKIRGSLTDETDVLNSVQNLFSSHFEKLEIPYMQMVYTVPPWLKFRVKRINIAKVLLIISSVKQWESNSTRTPYPNGTIALRNMLRKRFGGANMAQLFGPDDTLVDQLIHNCGGHFRDLLLLCSRVILRARKLPNLPVTQEIIDNAINEVRREFLPLSNQDALWLQAISETHDANLEDSGEDADRLARFLDSHTVLYINDSKEWYDVHPIIRDEVKRIATRATATPTPSPSP